ncbi:bile acid:sodium symporter [Bradyrhizobium sp. 61]|uniref:bile acid:sodium symporter family protein n=1 Tax=unclassified Bradyrhizobium TaxID=2631580 RepID=UPI001FF9C768|nr:MULTISPECIES: bile acid:sodium symporter [unclassified Bradyrhizobium]MCK1278348.1 bile acid:sodium symporter [Bradyrhizobium sp. 61]MCK1443678.1 bile acid:sodium symporter [Bradyrhizobium sp. 48]MCK1461788.1 bile acid:sodium symporter [Bradyrhizobium sp. 2]
MTATELLTPLSIALVFAMAITAGLKVGIDEIVSSLGRTRLIVLGLVASFILVPLITVVLLHLFQAPPLVSAGFLIVSVCAGAPFSVPGTTVAKGDVPYAVDLMIISAALSAILAPLLLALLLARLPGAGSLTIDYFGIAKTLLISQIIPLALALAFHHWKPDVAARLAKPMEMVQNLLVVAVVVCGLIAQWNQLAKFSLWAFGGMLLLVLIGTLVGWILGGPEKETRKALAFSTPQRNTGIAMVIASANFAGTPAVTVTVVLAVFLTLSGLIMQFVLRRL